MRKLIYILAIILLLGTYSAEGQSIKVVRTDVDSARSGFVTASYMFGIDIIVQDVQKCNGVAFELNFNHLDKVKFSGWKKRDFEQNVVIFDLLPIEEKGRIIVGTTTGHPLLENGIDNPVVISLEFVVLQTALHNSTFTIDLIQPVATVVTDSIEQIVQLTHERLDFRVHGFVNVWPGDTDNNGVVNHLDIAPVNLYMGKGSRTKNWRSFKRPNASTIWKPQRVLAWDSAAVTYADCDGNGEITARDILVVDYNIDRDTNTVFPGKIPIPLDSDLLPAPEIFSDETTLRIPIRIYPHNRILSAAGSISFAHFPANIEIVGIENGNIFTDEPYLFFHIDEEAASAQFAVGTYNRNKPELLTGILAYLVIRTNDSDFPLPNVQSLEGISEFGNFIPIDAITSINETNNNAETSPITVKQDFDYIYINFTGVNSANQLKLNIYNNMGVSVYNEQSQSNEWNISTSFLSSGIYFISIDDSNDTYLQSFIYTK
jgi:hypothetical protein